MKYNKVFITLLSLHYYFRPLNKLPLSNFKVIFFGVFSMSFSCYCPDNILQTLPASNYFINIHLSTLKLISCIEKNLKGILKSCFQFIDKLITLTIYHKTNQNYNNFSLCWTQHIPFVHSFYVCHSCYAY